MKGYESTLFNQPSNNDLTVKVQSGLSIGSGDVVPWRLKTNLSSIECSRVCSVISAYCLLDVVAMLDGAHPARSVKQYFCQVQNTSFCVSANVPTSSLLKHLQGMEKMANWSAVMKQFRAMLTRSKKTAEVTLQDWYGPFRLLRLIARNNTNKLYNAIEANFLYAAMHIACMKELHFPNEVCPDFPDNLDSLLRG
jgi:hypothetical protein